MRAPRRVLALVGLALASVLFFESPRAQGPPSAEIYGIGDLPGGSVGSAVRDATRVGGVIYAVGAGIAFNTTTLAQGLDSPALWSSSDPEVLTELPAGFEGGTNAFLNGQLSAYAITPSGLYIASQARFSSTSNLATWTRVTRTAVPNIEANLPLPGTVSAFAALSISDDGNVLYGLGSSAGLQTLRRHDVGSGTAPIDISPTGKTDGFPIPRGTSELGTVMVGVASNGVFVGSSTPSGPFGYPVFSTNSVGFRYRHNTGSVALLPHADDSGSWSFPVALSRDGMVTLAAGNSAANPNGEVYLINDANGRTLLGSPNTGMIPRLLGGMTDDGAVVVTFSNDPGFGPGQIPGVNLPNGINQPRIPYLHNDHGWVLLGTALRALNLDLEDLNWDPVSMAVTGVRTVEGFDLVFGQGRRRSFNSATGQFTNGALEGFVIEIPAGFLAGFDVPVTPPSVAAQPLLGAWVAGLATNPASVSVYLPDGRQVSFTQGTATFPAYQNGFELATFTWGGNGTEWRLTTRLDTTGASWGEQNFSARRGRLVSVVGDTFELTNTHCTQFTTPQCFAQIPRLVGDPGSIVGAWRITNPFKPGGLGVLVLMASAHNDRYFLMSLGGITPAAGETGDGFETGTYSLNGTELTLTPVVGEAVPPYTAVLSRDALMLDVSDAGGAANFARVADPASVVPVFTGPLTAAGTTGEPFTFSVTTVYAQTTTASGLPPGLVIDEDTGEITGTPTAHGAYAVQLTATNTLGLVTNTTLTITVKSHQATLTVGAPTTATFGETFTATPIGGNGDGDVTFIVSGVCSNTNGSAQVTMTSGTGSCLIYAEKAGDANYHPTASDPVTVTAAVATSTTTLGANPTSVGPGQAVTFTATVAPQFGGTVSGTVSFRRGGTTLGTASVSSAGIAELVLTTLGVGPHVVSATYSGDGNMTGSTSSPVTVTVVAPAAPSTTTIASSLNPSLVGDLVTFTATVTSSTPGTPTGMITFKQGPNPVATVPLSGGQATYSTSALPAGTTGLTAVYSGDATFVASTSTSITQQVNKATTTTTLASSLNPSNVGDLVTFTVTVTSSMGIPTGTVNFREGNAVIGTAQLNASGVAVFSTSSLTIGRHNIRALYLGDAANDNSASPVLGQVVR